MKTWPGAARPAARTARVRSATTSHGANSDRRVEVALQRAVRADPAGRLVQRHPEVDADHVGAGLAHQPEQLTGADAEVDARHAQLADRGQHRGRVRLHVARGSRRRAARRPRSRTAAPRWRPASTCTRRNAAVIPASRLHQGVPQLRVAVHQRLGVLVVARRPALDQVGGEGERRAGEADQRRRAELGDQQPHRLGDVVDVAAAPAARSWSRSAAVRIGWATTGPTPGLMSRSTPTAFSGTTMSLKRIAASTPCRRTGCRVISVTRSGRRAGLEHRDALADLAVLRQRPAGLAHEPHRGVRHRLAAAGAQEGGVAQSAAGQGRHGADVSRWAIVVTTAQPIAPIGG